MVWIEYGDIWHPVFRLSIWWSKWSDWECFGTVWKEEGTKAYKPLSASDHLGRTRFIWPERAMAPHSSTPAWKIPLAEEPGRLQSMGSRRVGHYWATSLSLFTFTFHFHALEKEMAAHSSVLAWRIPGTVEPGGLPSMGSHRVGHD